jgi:dienelactone hydrolase
MSSILKRFLKYFLYFISVAVVLAAGLVVYLIWFQSAFYFPKPIGPYAVGVKTYHWVDANRKEVLGDDPAHPNRELMVNIWYPAQPTHKGSCIPSFRGTSGMLQGKIDGKPNTLWASYLGNYYKKNKPVFWLLGYARPIYSYANLEALIIQNSQSYPVIIFSHGSGGTRDSNSVHCEELASHGYIVAGISHTYDSCVVEFPDGRIVAETKFVNDTRNFIERRKSADQGIETWIYDVSFVLDELEKLEKDAGSIFYKRLDLANIGMFGQSYGGATAVQVCRRDSRVKAGVNLDGSLFGADAIKSFNKPFMFMLAGNTVKMFEQEPMAKDDWSKFRISSLEEEMMVRGRYLLGFKKLSESVDHDFYTFVLNGAGHTSFTNAALFKEAALLLRSLMRIGVFGFGGDIDGFRATEIVNAYLGSFFDKYLKGKPSELLDGKSKKYSEVGELTWAQ